MSRTFPPFIPEEYQAGAQSWTSRAIHDLAQALHPILAEVQQEQASELPRPIEAGAGGELVSPMYQSLEVQHQFSITLDEVLDFDTEKFLATLYSVSDEFGAQLVRGMFQHISQVCEASGQVVGVDGRETFDVLADVLEKLNVEFDDEGNHRLILAVHPDTARKLAAITPTLEQELRVKQILERKWEEWRDSRRRRELP